MSSSGAFPGFSRHVLKRAAEEMEEGDGPVRPTKRQKLSVDRRSSVLSKALVENAARRPVKLLAFPKRKPLQLSALECIRTLGKGGYATVVLVRKKDGSVTAKPGRRQACYAVKIVPRPNQVRRRLHEQKVLERLPWNAFVTTLLTRLDDERNAYLVLEFMAHGTLFDLMDKAKHMSDAHTQFYVANVLCGLNFLHENGLVHCDVKPDNVLVGSDGYLALSDFGLSKHDHDRYWVGSGTLLYAAPEILTEDDCEKLKPDPQTWKEKKVIDYWALGCLAYEVRTAIGVFDSHKGDAHLKSCIRRGAKSLYWSKRPGKKCEDDFIHFVTSLLSVDPKRRLGYNGYKEIISHPWFSNRMYGNFNWSDIENRDAIPPLIPDNTDITKVVHSLPLPVQEAIPGLKVVEPSPLYRATKRK